MGRVLILLGSAALATALACTPNPNNQPRTGDTGSGGGAGAAVFMTAGSGGTGGLPPGTTGGTGASGGSGGTAGGGSGGSGGSGGADQPTAGQSGGSEPIDAGNTSPSSATPSAGCSKAPARPANGLISVPQSHYIAFPESYDGTKPLPVLWGFHGCGGGNRGTSASDTEWMRLTDGSPFEAEHIRVVPVSTDSGGCWNYGTDIAKVLQIHDDLLADHCVDTSRVFATGHSSGAQFAVQIVTQSHVSDAQHLGFKALAPVAASDYGPVAGPVAIMYIQGMMDSERGNGDGHETVERFKTANGCAGTSMPYTPVQGCQSGSTQVNPGCIAYDSCQAPTVWCSHNDPAYGGTMHGVPCFALTAMHDFFVSLL